MSATPIVYVRDFPENPEDAQAALLACSHRQYSAPDTQCFEITKTNCKVEIVAAGGRGSTVTHVVHSYTQKPIKA